MVGLPIRIGWFGDYATVYTQAKPGELAAADYPMVHVAPTYNAAPNVAPPADRVDGLGRLHRSPRPDDSHRLHPHLALDHRPR